MVQIQVRCHNCKKEFSFDPEKTRVKIMKVDKPMPKIFVPDCTHCGTENEVRIE